MSDYHKVPCVNYPWMSFKKHCWKITDVQLLSCHLFFASVCSWPSYLYNLTSATEFVHCCTEKFSHWGGDCRFFPRGWHLNAYRKTLVLCKCSYDWLIANYPITDGDCVLPKDMILVTFCAFVFCFFFVREKYLEITFFAKQLSWKELDHPQRPHVVPTEIFMSL